ncbi:MAG: GGDEF domain-containing protein, partial [Pseudomonadota bacterium]|nr:GGDEF domain-containing protein [Pseudomonadota bacterium]
PALINDPDKLEDLFKAKLTQSDDSQPQSMVYCEQACMQFVVEPIVQQNGEELYIALGQNMADVIWRYHNLTNSDLAVIISNPIVSQPVMDRLLPNWNSLVWAISRYEEMFPILNEFSKLNKQSSLEASELFSYSGSYFLLRPLDLYLYNPEGTSAQIIDIRDESEKQEQLWRSIWSGVATGLLALIVSEILLIFLMLGPIKRLIYIAEALNLLPKHQYQQVKKIISRKPVFIKDELTQLEDSTRTVSNELETLHEEVQKTNADLTEKLNALSRSRSFLTRLLDNSNLYIVTQNIEYQILSMNSKYKSEVTGASEDYLSIFSDNLSKHEFISEIEILIDQHSTDVFQQEIELLTENGETLFVAWTHTLVEDELGESIILSIGMDLTQRKQDEVALKWLANNDTLTKIGNRRAFKKDVDYMLESCETGAVVFIDINRFKQINDLYGHAIGDAVLIKISEVLKDAVRSNDSVSRLAGDEFTVVFQSVNEHDLEKLLSKMSKVLSGSLTATNGQYVEYSASIGAALYPEHGTDLQSLTVHADMAMYQAKKKGLNQWHVFNAEDNNLALFETEQALISLIRKALKPGAG